MFDTLEIESFKIKWNCIDSIYKEIKKYDVRDYYNLAQIIDKMVSKFLDNLKKVYSDKEKKIYKP